MIDRAVDDMNIDVSKSFIIGDRTVDVMTGINANLHTILVRQGYAGKDKKYKCKPDFIFNNLLEATQFILNDFEKILNILNSYLISFSENNTSAIISVGGLPKSGKSILSSVIKIALEKKNKKVNILNFDEIKISNIEKFNNKLKKSYFSFNQKTNSKSLTSNEILIIDGRTILNNEFVRKISNLNIYTEAPKDILKKRENKSTNLSGGEINFQPNNKINKELILVEKSKKYAKLIIDMNF